jgi:inorganic pyrophosphatase
VTEDPTAGARFWHTLAELAASAEVVVDRPRNSRHPKFETFVYPLDYGYLEGTSGGDGAGVDVWLGADGRELVGAFMTVDPYKRDVEVKLLLGCSDLDIEYIRAFYADQPQQAVLVRRPEELR